MSTEAAHIALANRNQAALDHLLTDEHTCSEWIAVVAFYKSLHVVEAIFAKESAPWHLHDHHKRLERLKTSRKYSLLFSPYRAMWSAALVARYLAHQPSDSSRREDSYACFNDYLPVANIRPKLLDNYLYSFEHLAEQLLGSSAKTLIRYSRTTTP
jgi:hypothetical protein